MKWIRSFGHSDQQLRTQWDCLPIPISIKSNPSETEAGGYIFPCKSAVVYFVASIRNDLIWTETSRGNLLETLKQRIEVTAIDMNANAIICISNNQYPQLQQDFEPQDLCALMLVSVVQDDITSTQLQDWLVKLNFFQQTLYKDVISWEGPTFFWPRSHMGGIRDPNPNCVGKYCVWIQGQRGRSSLRYI